MTHTKDEALKLALEALEGIHPGNMTPMAEEYWNKAITAIKQALAAPVQEKPCQHLHTISDGMSENEYCHDCEKFIGLYTPPAAQRQWVGLTNKDFKNVHDFNFIDGAYWADAKLKEKNT